MGRPWDADLPVVTVPSTAAPKPVTFVVPYYDNARFFQMQVAWWSQYPEHVKAFVSAIVVDDGSPEPAVLPKDLPFSVRLFRIEKDVRWNWLAARNIGMHHASEGWCVLTDMDHAIPASTAEALVLGKHHASVIYGFSRRESTGEARHAHPNSWFMTKAMFWRVGGYDEALSGHYGTDGEWRRRCATTAPMQILSDRLIRHEYHLDSSTTRYQRKQPIDRAVKKLVAARGKGWRPKTLSFDYHEVTAC